MYKLMTVSELLKATGAKLLFGCENTEILSFAVSSKRVKTGSCFVAVKGERTDGNLYISEAIKNGARVILTEKEPEKRATYATEKNLISEKRISYILSDNVYNAVSKAAIYFREKYIENIVAVTGSVGKTTVKELIYSVLSESIVFSKTEGNQNNQLGLPLTILSNNNAKNIVCELGISNKGEMCFLSEISKPNVSVITNIGVSHAEYFKGRENTAHEKLKIISGMRSGGRVIINGDEPLLSESRFLAEEAEKVGLEVISVSWLSDKSDYYVYNVNTVDGGTVFDIKKQGEPFLNGLFVPIHGLHGAIDSAFSVAVADVFGVSEENIRRGLKKYTPCGDRQRLIEKGGYLILLDCYNASPESFKASINAFEIIATERKINSRCIVAGSMLELGDITEYEHKKLGESIAALSPSLLITVGREAEYIADSAEKNGIKEIFRALPKVNGALVTKTPEKYAAGSCCAEKIASEIKKRLSKGSLILIKGSRALRLEEIIKYF